MDTQNIDWISKLPKDVPEVGNASSRYEKLMGERGIILEAAYRNAKLTLPNLIKETKNSNDVSQFPWQNVGSQGVGHLASNFNLSLFPSSGISFFSLLPDKIVIDNLVTFFKQQGMDGDAYRTKLESAAAALERKVMFMFDKLSIRAKMHKAFEHLIVTGNVLLYVGEDETFLYPMDRYVLRRSAGGKVLEILIKEQYYPDQIPQKFLQQHFMENPEDQRESFNRDIEVTTRVHYDYHSGLCFFWQECFNKLIPDSQSSCPINASPFIPMRYDSNDNSAYAEGLISHLFGTLVRLDGTTQSTSIGYAAAMRLLYLIDPAASFTPDRLKKAKRMDCFYGRADHISVVQGGKHQDLAASKVYEESLKNDLQMRFSMPIALQRSGERVTATEIQILSNQLESVSAGFFSLFASECQIPLVNRLLHLGKKQGMPTLDQIEEFKDENGEPLIQIKPITGLAALQRNDDLQRLMQFVQILQQLPQETIPTFLNMSELIQRISTALGVNVNNLVYSDEQIAERNAQAAQMEQEQQSQVMEMEQQKQDQSMVQSALNSSVITELIKTGQMSAQDLEMLSQQNPDNLSDTAAQVRPS